MISEATDTAWKNIGHQQQGVRKQEAKKMKRISQNQTRFGARTIVIAVVLAAAALAVFLKLRPAREETLKLGAVLSLSGPGSYSGEEVRDGLLLAIEEINSRGVINGRKIELILKDSKTNPQEAEIAFDRIEEEHHPLLYVSTLSSISVRLAPLSEENKVVLVGLVTASPKLTEQKEWVFRYYATAEHEVPPIISILDQLKVKELGILYLNDEYGISTAEPLREEFEKTGGIVKSVPFEAPTFDFEKEINQLKELEAIYTIGFVNHVGAILRQLKEENYDGFVLSAEAATTFNSLTAEVSVTDGVYVAAPIVYNQNFVLAQEVKGKYEDKYGKSFTHQSANGYDFIKLLAGLLEDEEISRDNLKRLLEAGFVHPGVFGNIDVEPGEHDIVFPLHPAQIVDGEITYLPR